MRKILGGLVGIILASGAIAADVAERQSCTDIKGRIDALAAQADLSDADAALLADLRGAYRRDCAARTAGRGARTIAATRSVSQDNTASEQEKAPEVEEPVIAEKCDAPDSNGCCPGEEFADMGANGKYCCKGDMCFPPMEVTPPEPQKSEEEIAAEIAANIEKGLCGDGSKPNKFGCCTGEIFKDLGNTTFACCKKDSDECFPPMK
ncbi:MAG: hypothetical protein K2I81_02180 [Alphaproteobacteria bacterium]|nr:hypothetical protein [Alphaproteobacteria bacterium]